MNHFRIIKQHDVRDCGAVCLAMIAQYFGLKHPISKYRELTKTDKAGANLYGIVEGGNKIGLHAEALSGSPEDLRNGLSDDSIPFPFIAHTVTDNGLLHYVVVIEMHDGGFIIADPAKGRCSLLFSDFYSIWTGYIVTFKKTDAFFSGDFTKSSNRRFFDLLKGQYHKLFGVLVLSLIISIVGVIGALAFEVVIDQFATDTGYYETHDAEECNDDCEEDHDHSSADPVSCFMTAVASIDFNIMFVALIILYGLLAFIQFARGYLIIDVARKLDISLSLTYFNHITDLTVSAINMRQTGEYLARFSDADTIRSAISNTTVTLLLDTIMVVGCGTILYLMNTRMFFVALLMIVLYAIIVICYQKPVENSNRIMMENNAYLQSYLKESIDGLDTVKEAHANRCIKQKAKDTYNVFIDSVAKNNFLAMTQGTLSTTVELVGTALILWIGFAMVSAGQITIGSLIAFYVLLSYFTEPIKNIISLQPTIQSAIVAADRINDILDLEIEPNSEFGDVIDKIHSVKIQNVDFRYGNRERILDDVSMEIHHGEKIAIVGESGSGKTTLAKLLLRFYQPENGMIYINGKEIKDIALDSLRQNIAYVDQNTFLFSDTIRNNLCLGNSEVTDEEVERACRMSQADQFIRELPMGYNTPLDENGSNLSGGQRQRLAIARALLKKPKLLILDEATSNLDTITEAAIKNTMFQVDQDLTCIIIAHRLSTIKNCDRIYVMEQGKIVETGTYKELMEKGERFARLWNMQ